MMIPSHGAKQFISCDSACGVRFMDSQIDRYKVCGYSRSQLPEMWRNEKLDSLFALMMDSPRPPVSDRCRRIRMWRAVDGHWKTFSLRVPAENIILIINWWWKASEDMLWMPFFSPDSEGHRHRSLRSVPRFSTSYYPWNGCKKKSHINMKSLRFTRRLIRTRLLIVGGALRKHKKWW